MTSNFQTSSYERVAEQSTGTSLTEVLMDWQQMSNQRSEKTRTMSGLAGDLLGSCFNFEPLAPSKSCIWPHAM